jgi:rhodanese-related sulfurtransferase
MAKNSVTTIPAAASELAHAHFSREFTFETDCADVHEAMKEKDLGFVLVDARGPAQFAAGHIPGSVNIPHRKIIQSKMSAYPMDTLFVVYCDGPHCNGATHAAVRLSALGRPVKKMVGGVHGWQLDGYELERGE